MATRAGQVIAVEKNGWAQVLTEKKDACGGCSPTHNCRTCLTASKLVTRVRNPLDAAPGDRVAVSMGFHALWQGAALLYLLPVSTMIAAAAGGAWLSARTGWSETLLSILFSLFGLAAGVGVTAQISRTVASGRRFTPYISKITLRAKNPSSTACALAEACGSRPLP